MKSLKNVGITVFIMVAALFIPVISNYMTLLSGRNIDGNSLGGGIILTIFFYSLQTGIAIIIGRFVFHISLTDMGFNCKNGKLTIKMLGWFIPIWLLLVILFYVIGLNCIAEFDAYVSHYYVIDKLRMQKNLVTKCLLAGFGEEPFFRGFIVSSLVTIIIRYVGIGKVKIPLVAIISGLLFALAHIEYQIMPFKIIYIDVVQLSVTFILGTFWSIMLIKTKSILGPIIAHTCANIFQVMGGYFVAYYIL